MRNDELNEQIFLMHEFRKFASAPAGPEELEW
jgi:hypothetical protein